MSFNLFSRSGQAADPDGVDFDELEEAVGSGAWSVVDVREPHEFAVGHIPNALNLPLSQFDPEELPQGKPVVLICQAGARSKNALSSGAGDRPRRRAPLCRGHERLALARRRRDALRLGSEFPRFARDIGLPHGAIVAHHHERE